MKMKLISLAIAAVVAAPFAAQAGSLKVANQDITLSGGLSGDYIYNSDIKRDSFAVTDALIDLASEAKPGGMAFDLGVGTLAGNNLAASLAPLTAIGSDSGGDPASVGVQYGWVSVLPVDGLKVDAGLLATNVGYELFPSYTTDNILHGLVWNYQPAFYTGARATYSTGGMSFYAEANKNNGFAGSAVGASGTFGPVNAYLNFFDTVNQKSIVDIIASGKAGSIKLAANLDYQTKAEAAKTTGTDDNAYGIALYASIPMGDKASLPLRIEYVNDGTSGLYGMQYVNPTTGNLESNTAMTFTVTPTYNFSDSTFVRAELAYVSTDKKSTYVDDKGVPTDSNMIVGFQGGVRF